MEGVILDGDIGNAFERVVWTVESRNVSREIRGWACQRYTPC